MNFKTLFLSTALLSLFATNPVMADVAIPPRSYFVQQAKNLLSQSKTTPEEKLFEAIIFNELKDDIKLNILATVVDGVKTKMYLKNFGEFFNNQVEAANTIVISKTDKMSEEKVLEVVNLIKEKNDHATIITTAINDLDSKQLVKVLEEKIPKTIEEIKNVESKYIALINEIVEVMVQENMKLDSFYKRLYESIFLSNILQQNNKTRAVFLKILSENVRFLPYYQAENLLIMTNDEYREHFQNLKPYILKAMHMLNRNFDSLTEIASQIYQIEKSVPNDTDQIVFLSAILGMIMHRNQEDEKPEDE